MVYNVALVGCGHRGLEMFDNLLKDDKRFRGTALADDVPAAMEGKGREGLLKFGYDEFWKSKAYEAADIVMVASINSLHVEHIRRPLQDWKIVFCEKPIYTRPNSEIISLIEANTPRFCSGFVLRHSPFYAKIKELVGEIGEIKSGTAQDLLHYGHGALIFGGGWRHEMEKSGGHAMEKLVHVIDLLVYYLGSEVVEANGFKGPDVWVPDHKGLHEEWKDNSDNPKILDAYKFYASKDPFDNDPKTIIESSGNVNMKFESGATIGLHFDTACPESRREFYLVGDQGTLHAVWTQTHSEIVVTTKGVGTKATKGQPGERMVYAFESMGCHGGGDDFIIDALKKTVIEKATPNPTAAESLLTMRSTFCVQEALSPHPKGCGCMICQHAREIIKADS